MNIFVPNGHLGLRLTDQVLQIVLESFCVFEEAHGYVIIRITVFQLRQKRATGKKKEKKNVIDHKDWTRGNVLDREPFQTILRYTVVGFDCGSSSSNETRRILPQDICGRVTNLSNSAKFWR